MLKECFVKALNRCAMPGTKIQISVPDMAQISYFTCQNIPDQAQNDGKQLCQQWHKNIFTNEKFLNFTCINKYMISKIIQWCNPCCEVCDSLNPMTTKSNEQVNHPNHYIYKPEILFF